MNSVALFGCYHIHRRYSACTRKCNRPRSSIGHAQRSRCCLPIEQRCKLHKGVEVQGDDKVVNLRGERLHEAHKQCRHRQGDDTNARGWPYARTVRAHDRLRLGVQWTVES